jgi:5-methylcytosine-specific restriction protein A
VALLYYWQPDNYRRDLDMGAGFHLNQANPLLHEVQLGESLWAFTRRPNGSYVLAAELVVRAKTINPPDFRYGRYRVWGDLEASRYFRVAGQPNAEDIIRSLSCRAKAKLLALSFQGHAAVRQVSAADHQVLSAAAQGLPLEERARVFPEERLEAELLLGNRDAIERLLGKDSPGMAAKRIRYLLQEAPSRDKEHTEALQTMYHGCCQVCGWDPKERYRKALCQGHHLHWISRGGADSMDNMALLCPSHHVAVHRCDAPFDYGRLSFIFPDHTEQLKFNQHLQKSA